MATRYYGFKFSNDEFEYLTVSEAIEYCKKNNVTIKHDPTKARVVKKIRDGFQSGFQHSLGMNITCQGEYKRELKRRGLVELGNDIKADHFKDKEVTQIDREDIEYAKCLGADLSDNDIDALIS